MESHLVSVVVANYNKEKYLEKCFAAFKHIDKGYQYEIIFIDDDSIVAAEEIFRTLPRQVQVIKNNENKGPSFCRNIGIRLAKGEYILFLDSDAEMAITALQAMEEQMGQYDIIFPLTKFDNGKIKSPIDDFGRKYIMDSVVFLIRRAVLTEKDIFFDEKMRLVEDADFFLRLKKENTKNLFLDTAVVFHPSVTVLSRDTYFLKLKNIIRLSLLGMFKHKYKYKMPWIVYLFGNLALYLWISVTKHNYSYRGREEEVYNSSRLSLVGLYFKAVFSSFSDINQIIK